MKMETKDLITIFEGAVYPVGTGSHAVTIPSKSMRMNNIEAGDVLMVGVIRVTKNHTLKSEDVSEVQKVGEKHKKGSGENPDAPSEITKRKYNFS